MLFLSFIDNKSIALKFETTVFLDMPRDVRVFHNSFTFQMFPKRFSPKNAWFFVAIKLCVFLLALLYNYLLICSLGFLNALKNLSLDLNFVSTS